MIANVGDTELLQWELRDPVSGALTDATVSCAILTAPTGAATGALTVTRASTGVYSVLVPLTVAGEWSGKWTASGAITATDGFTYLAVDPTDATWAVPEWAPSLRDVGAVIPTRTRQIGPSDTLTGTFSTSTIPTDEMVTTLIRQACIWAVAEAGLPVMAGAYPTLQLAATLYAAWAVEIAFPERDADVTVYQRLLDQATAVRASATTLNTALGGGGDVDAGPNEALPTHSFPDAPKWADVTFL